MRKDREDIDEAIAVCNQLQDWVDTFEELSSEPIVCVMITRYTIEIEIGGIGVYCCQEGYDNETVTLLDHCKAEFIKSLDNFAAMRRSIG